MAGRGHVAILPLGSRVRVPLHGETAQDMSTGHILLLGLIAGATIFIGLPVARMKSFSPVARAGLSALATGILLFLFWDVLTGAVEPVHAALDARQWGRF